MPLILHVTFTLTMDSLDLIQFYFYLKYVDILQVLAVKHNAVLSLSPIYRETDCFAIKTWMILQMLSSSQKLRFRVLEHLGSCFFFSMIPPKFKRGQYVTAVFIAYFYCPQVLWFCTCIVLAKVIAEIYGDITTSLKRQATRAVRWSDRLETNQSNLEVKLRVSTPSNNPSLFTTMVSTGGQSWSRKCVVNCDGCLQQTVCMIILLFTFISSFTDVCLTWRFVSNWSHCPCFLPFLFSHVIVFPDRRYW